LNLPRHLSVAAERFTGQWSIVESGMGAFEMRHSSQAVVGLCAILSIVAVQAKDMARGTRHAYAQALNGVNTDDGLIFDTTPAAVVGVRNNERSRRSSRAR